MALFNLTNQSLLTGSSPLPRFTLTEWQLTNRQANRCCLSQIKLADQVLAESARVRDQTDEVVRKNKAETDHQLEERIKVIEFLKREIVIQRKEIVTELDCLLTLYERILDSLNNLQTNAEMINAKCLLLREGRIGIDLCFDDVERELKKEREVILAVTMLLTRTAEQAKEQIRRLRSATYLMDRDLEAKEKAGRIDEINLNLRETSFNLQMYHGFADLDCSNITHEEWEAFTEKNIIDAAKEINSTRQFRSYVDTLLGQAAQDLIAQYNLVQAAFQRRIAQTKEIKMKLEVHHAEIMRQANEMMSNITQLEKAIVNKEGYMALSHTRLGNRAQRVGAELCRDIVETQLVEETRQVRENTHVLQQMLAEAQAALRYLLKTQIQLETDINIKTNSLKIDEVDCMTIRENIDHHAF